MIPDLDVFGAAKLLFDRHGEDALAYAARRLEMLTEEGDTEGVAIWRAIIRAMEALQRERQGGDPLH